MHRGLTVVELLIVLAIAGLLAGLANTAWRSHVAGSRATAAINGLAASVAIARSAAISGRRSIRFCPGKTPACGTRNTWHAGGVVFADLDDDRIVDADESVIASLPAFDHGHITWRSFRNRADLVFTPHGITDWLNGSFLYCHVSGDARHARMLILNSAGRARQAPDRNGDGIREDASGKPLRC